jgi:hypothetical protein
MKSKRGFASFDPERLREVSSRGGQASRDAGTAHRWTSEEAREAGRKGGKIAGKGRPKAVQP